MNLVFLFFLIAALACSLTAKNHEIRGRIFNGQDVEQGLVKFMAFIVAEEVSCCQLLVESNTCSGALIAPNWVLTAAHCLHGMSTVNVYLGSVVAKDANRVYTVSEHHFVTHNRYSYKELLNDVALIQIPKTVECDEIGYARLPLQLLDQPTDTIAHKRAHIMGFGRKGNKGKNSDHLQMAQVTVMHKEECKAMIPFINDRDICINTSIPFGSICLGDSGGPLVLEESNEVIGIASFLPNSTCENGDPNIFMRATSYLPWILKVIGESYFKSYFV